MRKLTLTIEDEAQKDKLNKLFLQAGVTGYMRKPGDVVSAGIRALADGNLRLENTDALQEILDIACQLEPSNSDKKDLRRIKQICENAFADYKIRQGLLKQQA